MTRDLLPAGSLGAILKPAGRIGLLGIQPERPHQKPASHSESSFTMGAGFQCGPYVVGDRADGRRQRIRAGRNLDTALDHRGGLPGICQALSADHRGGVVVYGDASGNSQHTTGASDYQIVRDYFRANYGGRIEYRVPKANPSVRDRVMLTNSKLRTAAQEIRLWVDPKCKELIKDFEQVSYKADSNAIDKEKDRRRTRIIRRTRLLIVAGVPVDARDG